jgi:predicted nucleic acid-binding protein
MDIVIDASAIIAVIANEKEKLVIIEQTNGANLIAPPSIHFEIGNAFSAMLKRQRISINQATTALQIYSKIPIRFVPIELPESLHIANELGIYAYDAYLIYCAEKYRSPLLTLDKGLHNRAQHYGVQLLEVGI